MFLAKLDKEIFSQISGQKKSLKAFIRRWPQMAAEKAGS
jgi:hypothetical protein